MMTSIIEAIHWKAWASSEHGINTKYHHKRVTVTTSDVSGEWSVSAKLYGYTSAMEPVELSCRTATALTAEGLVVAEIEALSWLRDDLEKRGIVPPMTAATTYEPEEE